MLFNLIFGLIVGILVAAIAVILMTVLRTPLGGFTTLGIILFVMGTVAAYLSTSDYTDEHRK